MSPARCATYCDSETDSDSDDLPELMRRDYGNDSETDSDSDDDCRRNRMTNKRTRINVDPVSSINERESDCKMHCCGSKNDPSVESATVRSSAKERKEDDCLIEQKENNLNHSNAVNDPSCNHQELLISCDSCKRCSIEGHDIELLVSQIVTHGKNTVQCVEWN